MNNGKDKGTKKMKTVRASEYAQVWLYRGWYLPIEWVIANAVLRDRDQKVKFFKWLIDKKTRENANITKYKVRNLPSNDSSANVIHSDLTYIFKIKHFKP